MSANRLWRKTDLPAAFPLPPFRAEEEAPVYNANNGAGVQAFQNAKEAEAVDYAARLSDAGWTLQSDRRSGENRFLTLRRGTDAARLLFLGGRDELRLLYEPEALFPPEKADCPDSAPCCLRGLSLDQREIDCGMSYIVRACDGSLFVIDGGYFTKGEDDRLFAALSDLSDGGEIRICGWYFTHIHQDHIGCFMEMTKHYRGRFSVEGFYYNFPSLALPEADEWRAEDNVTSAEFYALMESCYADTPHYKITTGQTFSIRNLDFEVLLSHEVIYPGRVGNHNDASSVVALTVRGQRILFLGDTGEEESRLLLEMYGPLLKSDIVQVAHHGFNGADREVYRLADAAVTLWPTADYRLEGDLWRPANRFLAYEHPSEHLIAGFGDFHLPLPYTAGSVRDNSDRFPPQGDTARK